jgi:homoserine O-succinyltransferase/O-acetyltransferase
MPLNIPDKLPAVNILKRENIFVISQAKASKQDIRPLKIAILNLMPIKVTTETDLIRVLSNSPLQVELDFIRLKTHNSKNTPIEHIRQFYIEFEKIKDKKYDGLIITGAPVEQHEFEEVNYWSEITQIFDWAKTNVTSSLFICWSAQAALYHYYKVPKYPLAKKLFGVFEHHVSAPLNPLFRGFDDVFHVPHSRNTEVRKADIQRNHKLIILSESEEAGVHIVLARGGREIFVSGHSEYAPDTLANEYKRDIGKGLPISIPKNYFPEDNTTLDPIVRWRSHANLLFSNWLNYYVYQATPFDIDTIH